MPPRLARLFAVLTAVALVVGAFALRGALGDDDLPSGRSADDEGAEGEGRPFRIACDDDLGAACDVLAAETGDAVEVVVVVASQAFAPLAAGEVAYDAWLTLDPWPAMVATTGAPGPVVAVTPPVEVASARLAVLADPQATGCDAAPTDWDCLAEPIDPPVGVAIPGTATGTLTLAAAVAGLLGTTDFGIGDVTDEIRVEVEDLFISLSSTRRAPVADQTDLMRQPGNFSAVVAPQGRAEDEAASAQGLDRGLAVVALEPAVTLGVTLVGIGPRGPEALEALGEVATSQTVVQALGREGWTGPPGPTTGLPDPDVIFALQKDLA